MEEWCFLAFSSWFFSVYFRICPESICLGMAPPQLARSSRKCPIDLSIGQFYRGILSIKIPSSQACLGLHQVYQNQSPPYFLQHIDGETESSLSTEFSPRSHSREGWGFFPCCLAKQPRSLPTMPSQKAQGMLPIPSSLHIASLDCFCCKHRAHLFPSHAHRSHSGCQSLCVLSQGSQEQQSHGFHTDSQQKISHSKIDIWPSFWSREEYLHYPGTPLHHVSLPHCLASYCS